MDPDAPDAYPVRPIDLGTDMTSVNCKDCRYFRTAPYEAPLSGCWHPDNMKVTQKDAFLDQQQQPGNNRKINLRGDCAQYEAKQPEPSFWQRFLSMGA
jgi:hypothetical protein